MLRGGLLGAILLLAVPSVAALSLDLRPEALPVSVDAQVDVPGVASIAASPSGADVTVDAVPVPLAVDVPLPPAAVPVLPLAPLPVTLPGIVPASAPAPQPAAKPHTALTDVPVAVAAPAAGGLAALAIGAWAALRYGLAAIPFAGRLFSRIDGPAVLDNPVRQQLHDLITSHPGLGIDELRLAAGVAWGTTVHHLRRLERHGLVVSQAEGRHRRFFPANTEVARHRVGIATLAQPTTRRIAQLVHDSPGIAQGDLCARLGLQAPAASKHLGRLAGQGLLTVRPDGRWRRYEATDELRVALAAAV